MSGTFDRRCGARLVVEVKFAILKRSTKAHSNGRSFADCGNSKDE